MAQIVSKNLNQVSSAVGDVLLGVNDTDQSVTLVDSPKALEQTTSTAEETVATLPIEIISMIAELLVNGGKEAWKALVAMTRVSKRFRAGSLPILVRDLSAVGPHREAGLKLLKTPYETVLRHVRHAKLDFEGKLGADLHHAFLKAAGHNLRSLSICMQAPSAYKTAKILNTALSDKLESLAIIYACRSLGLTGKPSRLQIPKSVKKIHFQFYADGIEDAEPIEKHVWLAVDKLPNLQEWSFTIDPKTNPETQIWLDGFPTTKGHLLLSVAASPPLLSQMGRLRGFSARQVQVCGMGRTPWKVFAGWAFFANMTSITQLTLENVSLDAELFLALPPQLEELYLLEANIVGTSVQTYPTRIVNTFPPIVRHNVVQTLFQLQRFRLLYFSSFYGEYSFGHEFLDPQIAFWRSLSQDPQVPFAVVIRRS